MLWSRKNFNFNFWKIWSFKFFLTSFLSYFLLNLNSFFEFKRPELTVHSILTVAHCVVCIKPSDGISIIMWLGIRIVLTVLKSPLYLGEPCSLRKRPKTGWKVSTSVLGASQLNNSTQVEIFGQLQGCSTVVIRYFKTWIEISRQNCNNFFSNIS